MASHDFFAFTQWQTQCAHPLWMKLASGKGIFDRILSYRWSKQRRGALQFVRYITNEAAIFLGLTLAHVKSFSCKFMVCLSKTFGCILSSFFRSNPLNADSCASMPDRDAQFAKNAMHGSSVHLPINNEPSEASLFCDVSEFCGIKDIHSFDGFHSFFDFLRNTFFHNRYVLVEGKVTKKNRNTKVFNLSIDKDESYIVPVGIAHNCRCTVVQVRKQKYPATEHAEAMSRGEEAMNGERYNIFRFNSGKQGKTMPDYNPYTIKRCNDCDVAKGKLKLGFVPDYQLCQGCIMIRKCSEDRNKDNSAKATKKSPEVKKLQGTTISNPDFNHEVLISGSSIKEWTNQPHKDYAAKNSILKHIAKVFREANYIGVVDNFKQKPGVIQSHLFETTVLGDVSWIVIREYDDGRFILHSLSDGDRIKTGMRKE